MLKDKFMVKCDQVLENHCDMRPIFNIILLGMQDYQAEKTQYDALNCLLSLATTQEGRFRQQIFKCAKHTTIKQDLKQDLADGEQRHRTHLTPGRRRVPRMKLSKFSVHGFFQTCSALMGHGNTQLAQLSCYVMLSVCQANLLELFLN